MKRAAIGHLFLFVLAYDTVAMLQKKQTITAAFRGSLVESPVYTTLGTIYVLAHLFDRPKNFRRIDLFNGYALLFGYAGKRLARKRT
jgi:hypothetical protein